MSKPPLLTNLRKLFEECSRENKDFLNKEEFKQLCLKIGLSETAATKTFERLDVDKDHKVTFEEFLAGFNKYKQSSTPPRTSSPGKPTRAETVCKSSSQRVLTQSGPSLHQATSVSPSTLRKSPTQESPKQQMPSTLNSSPHQAAISRTGRKSASPLSMITIDTGQTDCVAPSNIIQTSSTINLLSGSGSGSSGFIAGTDGSGSEMNSLDSQFQQNIYSSNQSGYNSGHQSQHHSMVIYSNDGVGSPGSQLGSLPQSVSNNSINQFRSFQDLMESVQKLQHENQMLAQVLMKDRKERDDYINQLGEEFDLQVKQVEERYSKKASEEVDMERRKYREMIQKELDKLQEHYKAVEKMSNMIKTKTLKVDDNNSLESVPEDVISKLEDTYQENRKLKKSLLDTKSEVASIKEEMDRLKKLNEDKLRNADAKNNETRNECANIKQQLSQMKDSNRRLQDANDAITIYINETVEPVLKGQGDESIQGISASNNIYDSDSRRGSILGEYLLPKNEHQATTSKTISSIDSKYNHQVIRDKEVKGEVNAPEVSVFHENSSMQISGLNDIFSAFANKQQDSLCVNKKEKNIDTLTKIKGHIDDEVRVDSSDIAGRFHVILVGDSFVGKSSFASRFMGGSFVQGLMSNCSIDFKTKNFKVDGLTYAIDLWDTAGQERFRSITASYYRKADGIVLMYDVTEKRSYLNVRNWMSTIADSASENVIVMLVGNKIDLRNESNKLNCVPIEEGERLAREYNIMFLETSIKTGSNFDSSVNQLIRSIAEKREPKVENDTIKLGYKSKSFGCMSKSC